MTSLLLQEELHVTLASHAIAAATIAPSNNSSMSCGSQLPLQLQAARVPPTKTTCSSNINSDGSFVPPFLDVPPLAARPGTVFESPGYKHLALQSSWIQRLRGGHPPVEAAQKPQSVFSKLWENSAPPPPQPQPRRQRQHQQRLWESSSILRKDLDESVGCCTSEHRNLIPFVADTATATAHLVSGSCQGDTSLPFPVFEERIDSSVMAPTSIPGKLESEYYGSFSSSRSHTVVWRFSQEILSENHKRRRVCVSASDTKSHAKVAEKLARRKESSSNGGAAAALDGAAQECCIFPEDLCEKEVIKDAEKSSSTQPLNLRKQRADAKRVDQTPNLTPLFSPLESILRMKCQSFKSKLEMPNPDHTFDQAPKQAVPIFKALNSRKDGIFADPNALHENSFVHI